MTVKKTGEKTVLVGAGKYEKLWLTEILHTYYTRWKEITPLCSV